LLVAGSVANLTRQQLSQDGHITGTQETNLFSRKGAAFPFSPTFSLDNVVGAIKKEKKLERITLIKSLDHCREGNRLAIT